MGPYSGRVTEVSNETYTSSFHWKSSGDMSIVYCWPHDLKVRKRTLANLFIGWNPLFPYFGYGHGVFRGETFNRGSGSTRLDYVLSHKISTTSVLSTLPPSHLLSGRLLLPPCDSGGLESSDDRMWDRSLTG